MDHEKHGVRRKFFPDYSPNFNLDCLELFIGDELIKSMMMESTLVFRTVLALK